MCQSQGAIAKETLQCDCHLMLLPAQGWETCRILHAVVLQTNLGSSSEGRGAQGFWQAACSAGCTTSHGRV